MSEARAIPAGRRDEQGVAGGVAEVSCVGGGRGNSLAPNLHAGHGCTRTTRDGVWFFRPDETPRRECPLPPRGLRILLMLITCLKNQKAAFARLRYNYWDGPPPRPLEGVEVNTGGVPWRFAPSVSI